MYVFCIKEEYTTQLRKLSINIFGEQEEQSISWTALSSCQRWHAVLGGSVVRSRVAVSLLLLLAQLELVRVPCKQVMHFSALGWGTVGPLQVKKPSWILQTFILISAPVALFHMLLAKVFYFSVPPSLSPKTLGLRDKIHS